MSSGPNLPSFPRKRESSVVPVRKPLGPRVRGDDSLRRRSAADLVALLLAALTLVSAPARGALFEDDDARKRIEALRLRVDQIESRLGTLEGTVKSQGLVDLLQDIEQIKSDVAKLRGQQEVLAYDLEQAQKRQRDLYLDLDGRLRKLETAATASAAAPPAGAPGAPGADTGAAPGALPPPGGAPAPGAAASPGQQRPLAAAADLVTEQRAYDAALDQFKNGNYAQAIASFQAFARTYPKSPLAPSALYWQGNAQYAQRDFRGAIATQRQLVATYPDSQKVPDALLNIASCYSELGDNAGARRTLQDLVTRFPSSDAAAKAKQRLGR